MALIIMSGLDTEDSFEPDERCSLCHAYIWPILWVRCYETLIGICGRCVGELLVARDELKHRREKRDKREEREERA